MSTAKQKILIVDDEPDILELIEYNLKKEGYQVFLANNGQEGITIAKKVHPDLIILDIMMPKMDGFTLAEKCINFNPDIPFLFLTARNQSEDKIKGLKLGADDYIIKPFEADELVLRLNNILKRTSKTIQSSQKSIFIHIRLIQTCGDKVYMLGEKLVSHFLPD